VRVTERRFGEAAIFELHGDIVGPHASELLQIAIRGQLLSAARVLILDMLDVTAIDRDGLEALSSAARTVSQQQGELRIAGRRGRLSVIGALAAVEGTIPAFESVEDALGDVRQALEQRHSSARWSMHRWDERLRRLFGCV
jgi:anti-anti-sigma regulatory factor